MQSGFKQRLRKVLEARSVRRLDLLSVTQALWGRVRQPFPQVPQELSPLPLPSFGRQGAAPCISGVYQYLIYHIA